MDAKILQWAKERNLLPGDPHKQFIKLVEEIGELSSAITKNNKLDIIDAIGDIQVVLIILSKQLDIDYHGALEVAYYQIKDRKGKTENGVFIKD